MAGSAARLMLDSLRTRQWSLPPRLLGAGLLVLVALFLQVGARAERSDSAFGLIFSSNLRAELAATTPITYTTPILWWR